MIPDPVLIYHITAIDNLDGILEKGCLKSKNRLSCEGASSKSIAYQSIQGRRAVKKVTKGPGGTLHDYVPFYFAPRSPMLFTIDKGNVEDCDYRQTDIAHVVSSIDKVIDAGYDFVFFDMNAAVGYSTPYDDLSNLDQIDWKLFFEDPRLSGYCKYWSNSVNKPEYAFRMETRQAEFLVHEEFHCEHIMEIGVINRARKSHVERILVKYDRAIPVNVQPNWYF